MLIKGVSMKKLLILVSISLLVTLAYAQTSGTAQPPASQAPPAADAGKTLPELLGWMIGEWEGEGVSRGEREFLGKLSVIPELDSTALLVHRESSTKGENIAGGLKELMIIGYDGTTKKIVATLYDNKNSIALYVGELKTNEIVFNLATAQQGYLSRRSIKLMPDGAMSFVIEGATPGKEVSKLVEINFKKKA
jgi:hypothetical protein